MCACAVRRGWFNLQHFREMYVPLVVRSPEEGQIPGERKQKKLATMHCKKAKYRVCSGQGELKDVSTQYMKISQPKKDC